ncbi:prolipoprotein diacylglyceryl transferase [Aestuariispira ectoiniformans]|uniref:prolipoprotein diacylglyceryl transferase n=1 Tax=Aestuariispira ectoiniformans TaxID=2775080 RepID=UPI0021E3B711|nr:prolipoprotein diacylglyceryl transferase [Aestuariispira ectoiniformans]
MGPYMFPDIDPIALDLGIVQIRWYALAYITGLVFGWWYAMRVAKSAPNVITPKHVDDFMVWAVVGVIIGGRLGHVLFYYPSYYLSNPIEILKVWEGGMAFHGGLIGVIVAMILFARKYGFSVFYLSDLVSVVAPVGLFFGRIANFINQELWGRVTDVPWAVIFPRAGPEPRHPSQLYEAGLEGLIPFLILMAMLHWGKARYRPGLLTGAFTALYAIGRIIGETVREPEVFIDALPFATTYGQWLSLPMLFFGLFLMARAYKRPLLEAK